jgi:hypothetical protein
MILRRVINNLKSQNWVGLSLELIVLVAGVFLGLQVDDWNEGRKDRAEEKLYLERLHEELVVDIAAKQDETISTARRAEYLSQTLAILLGGDELSALTDKHCNSLTVSHMLRWTPIELAVLDEMTVSGYLSGLSDASLRQALFELLQLNVRNASEIEMMRQNQRPIVVFFPLLLEYSATDADETPGPNCQWPLMKSDPNFIGTLLNARARMSALVRRDTEEMGALQVLHENLDRNLGLQHAEKSS